MVITFSTYADRVKSNRLSGDINKHGGGGTTITSGFQVLERELEAM